MPTTVTIHEAQYIDPRAGNDKFYRVFSFGPHWCTQNGPNGSSGTVRAIKTAASPQAAEDAAMATMTKKIKAGYKPTRSGVISTSAAITDTNATLLDDLAQQLPLNSGTATITTTPIAAIEMATSLPNVVPSVRYALATSDKWAAQAQDTVPTVPMRPMLAANPTPAQLEAAMLDPNWVAQFKYDGDRVVIVVDNGAVTVLGRSGEAKVRSVSVAQLAIFTALHTGRWVFDGEMVGRTLVLFDMMMATDDGTTWVDDGLAFVLRHRVLSIVVGQLRLNSPDAPELEIAPVAGRDDTYPSKNQLLDRAIADKREGVMLRDAWGLYEQGRRSTYLLKHKFTNDADVIVAGLIDGKDSVRLTVVDADGNSIEVGRASIIGKGAVNVGDVWTVTFLYVMSPEHPTMVQPRLARRRTDKQPSQCLLDQFANAGTRKIV